MNVKELKVGQIWQIENVDGSRAIGAPAVDSILFWHVDSVDYPENHSSHYSASRVLAEPLGEIKANDLVLILATNYDHTTDQEFVKILFGDVVGWAALGLNRVYAKILS